MYCTVLYCVGTHSYYYRVAIENTGEEAVRLVGR